MQLLAVWVLADWKSRGETTPIQLVEMGPGRGTLLNDILRVCGMHVMGQCNLHSVIRVVSSRYLKVSKPHHCRSFFT